MSEPTPIRPGLPISDPTPLPPLPAISTASSLHAQGSYLDREEMRSAAARFAEVRSQMAGTVANVLADLERASQAAADLGQPPYSLMIADGLPRAFEALAEHNLRAIAGIRAKAGMR